MGTEPPALECDNCGSTNIEYGSRMNEGQEQNVSCNSCRAQGTIVEKSGGISVYWER